MSSAVSQKLLSRSLRIRPDTLSALETEAVQLGKGITVHIRDILEAHVSTNQLIQNLWDTTNTFEIRDPLVY